MRKDITIEKLMLRGKNNKKTSTFIINIKMLVFI